MKKKAIIALILLVFIAVLVYFIVKGINGERQPTQDWGVDEPPRDEGAITPAESAFIGAQRAMKRFEEEAEHLKGLV